MTNLIKKFQHSGKIEEGRSTGKPVNTSKKIDTRMHYLHGIPLTYTRETLNPNSLDWTDFYNDHGYSLNTQLKNNKQNELLPEVFLTEPKSNKFKEFRVGFSSTQLEDNGRPLKSMTRTSVVENATDRKPFSLLPLMTEDNIPIKYRVLEATPENIEGALSGMDPSLFNAVLTKWKKYQGKVIDPHSKDSAIFNINNGFTPEEFTKFINRR